MGENDHMGEAAPVVAARSLGGSTPAEPGRLPGGSPLGCLMASNPARGEDFDPAVRLGVGDDLRGAIKRHPLSRAAEDAAKASPGSAA